MILFELQVITNHKYLVQEVLTNGHITPKSVLRGCQGHIQTPFLCRRPCIWRRPTTILLVLHSLATTDYNGQLYM